MSLRFFRVSAIGDVDEEQALNSFLDTHRVVSVERQLVEIGTNSFWAICVENIAGNVPSKSNTKKPRVDYKEILSPVQFSKFVQLRELRQTLAKQEAVPVYTIFTNEQLAAMVTQETDTVAKIKEIPGIGQARIDKYGEAFIRTLAGEPDEASQ